MHDTHPPADSPPFFIVGTQRSGTTLLRLILNAHSKIAIPEEARFLMPLLNETYLRQGVKGAELKSLVNYLAANDEFKLWNYDAQPFLDWLAQKEEISLRELIDSMFKSYCHSEGKTIWGDKSLFFRTIWILNELFPNARFIHIVRDGRDVFDSWRKMDPTKNNAAVMALDWRYKLYKIERSFGAIQAERTFTLRYEDLLENPETTIQHICNFLGITYEPAMLEFHKTSHNYIGEHHSNLIFKAIDNSNSAKWQKNLTSLEINSFNLLAKPCLGKFGYKLPPGEIFPNDLLKIALHLIIGIPKRIYQVARTSWAGAKALKKGEAVKGVQVGIMPKGTKNAQ